MVIWQSMILMSFINIVIYCFTTIQNHFVSWLEWGGTFRASEIPGVEIFSLSNSWDGGTLVLEKWCIISMDITRSYNRNCSFLSAIFRATKTYFRRWLIILYVEIWPVLPKNSLDTYKITISYLWSTASATLYLFNQDFA